MSGDGAPHTTRPTEQLLIPSVLSPSKPAASARATPAPGQVSATRGSQGDGARSIIHPPSPRDSTPIVINGATVPRESIVSSPPESPIKPSTPARVVTSPSTVVSLPQIPIAQPKSPAPPRSAEVVDVEALVTKRVQEEMSKFYAGLKPVNIDDYVKQYVAANLPQIQQQGDIKIIPNYDMMPQEEQTFHMERFRHKFQELANEWPDLQIKFPEGSSLRIIHKIYDDKCESIMAHIDVGEYRIWMVVIWFGMEIFATRWMGLNATGFAKAQYTGMKKYEKLLKELRGKSFEIGANWAVEVRLLLMSGINLILLIVLNIVSDYAGPTAAAFLKSVVDSLLGGESSPNGQPSRPTNDAAGMLAQVASFMGNLGINLNVPQQQQPQPARTGRTRPRYDQ